MTADMNPLEQMVWARVFADTYMSNLADGEVSLYRETPYAIAEADKAIERLRREIAEEAAE